MKRAAASLVCAALLSTGAQAHVGNHAVTVDANSFTPPELRVDPGETVTWNVLQEGHTITADDGEFDFRGTSGGTIAAGETPQWQAPAIDVRVAYHCTVHVGMVGVLTVGNPPLPPPPPPEPVELRRVPEEYPTLADALRDIPARIRVELAPGTYPTRGDTVLPATGIDPRANVVIQIAGTGTSAAEVVLVPTPGTVGTGLGIGASHVVVEHLTVRGFPTAIALDRVTDIVLSDVTLEGSQYGVRAVGSSNVRLDQVHASGAAVAGIAIERCTVCDVLVTDASVAGNLAGIAAIDAGAVVVLGSHVHDNGVGIVIRRDPAAAVPPRGAHVVSNTIEHNTATGFSPAAGLRPLHAGVWIDGAWSAVVGANHLSAQRWGVLVTGLGGPVMDGRVTSNALGPHEEAALAWDGIGAGMCFVGNGDVSSQPSDIQTLYPCERPTVGIPYPPVTLAALA
jgi:plastocyanin